MPWPTMRLRVGGALSLVVFVALAFTPLASRLSHCLERTPVIEPASAVVVLGGGGVHPDGTLTDVSMRRTLRGIDLYQRDLAPWLVLSGAWTRSGVSEAGVRAT